MGRSPERGVVDQYGQVFGYPGLSVADGSVLPGPVGPEPVADDRGGRGPLGRVDALQLELARGRGGRP